MMDVLAWLVFFICCAAALGFVVLALDHLWYAAKWGDQNAQIMLWTLAAFAISAGFAWSSSYLFGGGA